ncbi:glycosyltransferase family 4 protein [Roseivirga sp. E12]|uniref:glycosyltransferase family 4 protein n=1 Tax=Roseivirga sp. E12 TaxID=2819237 RepID=UPI001ABC8399|nr:glycosyltransferase family 4 protein [Roseivirga sp. E12]MBO3700135.1 glycosyltransferase family 4 protein [Roseivirga sp. E12]
MEKLSILFLTYQGDVAGSTNSIAYLAKGLADRGHSIHVGIRKESLLWQLLEGSKVNRIPMTFKGKFDLTNWGQIRDAVKTHKIQLINSQSSHDRYTSIFANIRYGLGVKIVHTRRQMPLSVGGPLQRFLYNKKTNGIVAVSQQVKEGLAGLGFHADHIKVIHNGTPTSKYGHINTENVEKLRQKFSIKPDEFVLGCVSRMKNQVQIFQALAKINEPIKAIFCGITPTEEIKELIERFSTNHEIYFEGQVEAPAILDYYKLFDAKILASTMEGLSQSLLEAMALGVPVIATAYAGNLDLIENGENGLLFPDNDIDQIAQNILKMKESKGLREKLITNGKKTALETFNIENTISNYEQYFSDLIKEI